MPVGTGRPDERAAVERILVAGATGKTGRRAIAHLAGSDPTVRAMTRSDPRADRLREHGADEVVIGDLLDPTDAERAVDDVDAVLTCVGSTPLQVHLADEHVDGLGNRHLIEASAAADVGAFVMQSSLGAGEEPSSFQGRFFRLIVGPVVAAKSEAEQSLREADLRHTIFRPGLLFSYGPGGASVAEAGAGLWGAVTRGYVAKLMTAAPFTPAAADTTFEVAGNPLQRDAGRDIEWRFQE